MTKTWGILLALSGGALIGWVSQQFWGVTGDHIAGGSRDVLMSRNETRLKELKRLQEDKPVFELALPSSNQSEVEQLLEHVAAGKVDAATQKYREHLNEYSQDLSLSREIVEQWLNIGDYEATLALLYDQRLFIAFEHEDELLRLIYETVEKIEQGLSDQNDFPALVSLYRLLVSLHGDRTPYYLRLTHWLIESGEFYDAEQSLAGALNDIEFQKEVDVLKARIEREDSDLRAGEIVIPLNKVGEHYVAEALLDALYPVQLMIDTGATMSVLKTDVIDAISTEILASAQSMQITTANGLVSGQKVTVQSFGLGSIQLNNLEVGVVPLPNFKFDGLLGMNVLNQFEFFIDQEKQLLLLR